MDAGGGETPSSSISTAASSSSPSSGSGRPHSAGAIFSFNIPIGLHQSDTETVDSQELLAVIGNVHDDDAEGASRNVELVQQLTSHFLHETNSDIGGSHGDTMLFLLPSSGGPASADSPHLGGQRQRHGAPDTDTSPSENKENTAPNSPLVASANYKQGNYFRFPDVDAWPSASVKINADQLSSCSTPSDTLTLGILSPQDTLLPEAPRNSPMRRARLKSISLDSESAKAVEDTLNMDLQELCIHPPPPSPSIATDELLPPGITLGIEGPTRRSFRNKNQLKIDLKQEEYHPDGSGVDSRQHPPTPKTPTLTQSRQKAISLDSDQGSLKPPTETTTNCCLPTVSASVPTTPKRHLVLSTHQPHGQRINHPGHHQKISHHFYGHNYHHHHNHHQQHHYGFHQSTVTAHTNSIGSGSCRTKSRSTSEHLGSNLQRLKTVTLSVSNNNLKTLPEVMPLSDFGLTMTTTTSPPAAQSKSSAVTPSLIDAPPFGTVTTPSKGRSSLLQRRGSNHSLTLNLAGSVGDLSGSTSHIAPSASGYGLGSKRGLLQRRGSNASLTLTIQGSDSALSRFNSHGSLNEARVHRKGLLSVSNCNLRSSMDVSRLQVAAGNKAGHHGKFFSSEENLNNKNKLSYCRIEPIDDDERHTTAGSAELVDFDDEGVRQITTKPLSPQSTSEDFKIYLANIQYLQNASNVLHVNNIRDLGAVFKDLGAYAELEQKLGGSVASTRLSVDQERHLNVQRRKLRKIHQEFWDLPTNHQEKPMVFGSQHKNRYKTILPNEHSRVILKPELGDATRSEPYINANYIKGPADGTHELNYIATQGPMANTVFDFWLMAMQDTAGELGPTVGNHTHNKIYNSSFADSHRTCPVMLAEDAVSEEDEVSPILPPPPPTPGQAPSSSSRVASHKLYILMLTNFMESGRPKCATYFPEKPGNALCFFSGSGSDSQCEQSCPTETVDWDYANEWAPGSFRAWYEESVRNENTSDWQWIKSLRRSSIELSQSRGNLSQSESCFIVRNMGLREKTGYSVRDLSVTYVNGPTRTCYKFVVEHFWFPDWPDHKSPEDLNVVLDFAHDLLRVPGLTMSMRSTETVTESGGPGGGAAGAKVVLPILHCSAGIGRTGCMAGILNALRQLHSGTSQSSGSDAVLSSPSQSQTVDILGIVCNLRLQRGGMVQNSEQYELIHRVLCLYQEKVDAAFGILPPGSFLQPEKGAEE